MLASSMTPVGEYTFTANAMSTKLRFMTYSNV
jgi:hypothetical protein